MVHFIEYSLFVKRRYTGQYLFKKNIRFDVFLHFFDKFNISLNSWSFLEVMDPQAIKSICHYYNYNINSL